MPLQIIRQDITAMHVDAIVNPTNRNFKHDGGADAAIHNAAGPMLYEECKKIGTCSVGEAKTTKAYNLSCKLIIHTVGPIWRGGIFGEKKLLQACYRNCLQTAKNNECESIAIPLISSGTYKYPKDKVLQIAISEISEFLLDNEMMVYLVVFDKAAYELSKNLFEDIKAYIDESYLPQFNRPNFAQFNTQSIFDSKKRFSCYEITLPTESEYSKKRELLPNATVLSDTAPSPCCSEVTLNIAFDEEMKLSDSFSLTLLKLIDEKNMDEIKCYKKANVSKQTWYKIMNDKNYKPNKKTAISFAIALKLTLQETQDLLYSVGFILTKSSLFDVIIMYCISHEIYDVFEIDSILFKYDQETLFSKF